MTEPRLLFIDIEPKSGRLSSVKDTQQNPERAEKRLWTCSDNAFKFNFFSEDSPVPQQETAASDGNSPPAKATGLTAFTGQGSEFAFNFQIPPVPPEGMNSETTAIQTVSPPDSQSSAKKQKPSDAGIDSPLSESAVSSKAKKKKKSGKKKVPDSAGAQQNSAEGNRGDEGMVLTAEQQLERELDWCMEQLELGMRTQKGTPKQKEEASRALKTLRSSKAPLAKKRQVMRAMTGDYRKKMEEEKGKQLKLTQTAMTSAQIKVVPDSSKKSVFHRRAGTKTQAADPEDGSKTQTLQTQASTSNSSTEKQEETPHFVFTPSNEEFCFNFL
ncbi:UPF0488 protein C8orf33 homolog [Lampris incognitus]|uniref:UPF0488 protein C8orf33 homolog n=1 Tax=Lampris incognitus TaxID=2546036 RepID=UPI0024B57B9A|nr:UPF0488 protein C8orf33 homolog [Lampris incognitus]